MLRSPSVFRCSCFPRENSWNSAPTDVFISGVSSGLQRWPTCFLTSGGQTEDRRWRRANLQEEDHKRSSGVSLLIDKTHKNTLSAPGLIYLLLLVCFSFKMFNLLLFSSICRNCSAATSCSEKSDWPASTGRASCSSSHLLSFASLFPKLSLPARSVR